MQRGVVRVDVVVGWTLPCTEVTVLPVKYCFEVDVKELSPNVFSPHNWY